MSTSYEPDTQRLSALGLIVAPFMASFALAILLALGEWSQFEIDSIGDVFGAALVLLIFGAAPSTALLAMPLYFILRRRVQASAWLCALLGAAIGLVAFLVWDTGEFASAMLAKTLLAGGLGGLSFWWIARRELAKFNPPQH